MYERLYSRGTLDDSEKIDILVALRDGGLVFLVYEILQLVSVKDVCSVLQVSRSWNDWDDCYLWRRRLSSLLAGRGELADVLTGLDVETEAKLCVRRLQGLARSWRRSECRTVCVREDSSVLCVTSHLARLLVGLNSGEVAQYNMRTAELERRKEMHEKGVRVVRVEEDGSVLYTGSYDGTVKLWDSDWTPLTVLLVSVAVTDVVSQAGSLYVSGDLGNLGCYCREAERLRTVWSLSGGEMMNCLTVWADWLVTGSDTGQLEVRSRHTGAVEFCLTGHDRGSGISGLAVGVMGLWSASFDCKIMLWSRAGECLCVLRGHTDPVRCLHLDNSRLVSGDYRGFVMIWDMEDIRDEMATFRRRKLKQTKKAPSDIYRLEGRQVVRGGGDVCEVVQHNSLLEHRGNVTAVRLAGPDVLLSSSRDRTVNIHHFYPAQQHNNFERKSYF